METLPLTFVVGTGRNGSTTLSRILNLHPEVLSLNEMFSSLGHTCLPEGELTGDEFWEILRKPHTFWDRLLRDGLALPEFLYGPDGRHHATGDGIPPLCHMTLPHLTDDPDGLLDLIEEEVRGRTDKRSAARHYEELFGFLGGRFGRCTAVERSGYSLTMVDKLRTAFPYARFVHLYRNGPDCALSMSRHNGFRGAAVLQRARVDAFDKLPPEKVRRWYPELAGIEEASFAMTRLRDARMPVRDFGVMWSELVGLGTFVLSRVPANLRMSMSYERLVAQPHGELTRLAEFAGFTASPDWVKEGAAMLDGGRQGAAASLGFRERWALRRACAPGNRALRKAGLPTP